jgi:hypothetical protein
MPEPKFAVTKETQEGLRNFDLVTSLAHALTMLHLGAPVLGELGMNTRGEFVGFLVFRRAPLGVVQHALDGMRADVDSQFSRLEELTQRAMLESVKDATKQ